MNIEIGPEAMRDLADLETAFRKLPGVTMRKVIRREIPRVMKPLRDGAKLITPRYTGNLRRSLKITQSTSKAKGSVFATRLLYDASKGGPHAHFLESGTKPRRTKSGAYRGKVAPTRFFSKFAKPQLPAITQALVQRLAAGLEEAAKELMRK